MNRINTFGALLALLVLYSFAQGATNDLTVGGTSGYSAAAPVPILAAKTVDFTVTTGTSNDIYAVLNVPAGTFVAGVGYEIEDNGTYTGEDSTLTIDIGDGTDRDGWFDGANVETGQTATAWSTWAFGTVSTYVTGVTDTTGDFATNVTVTTADITYDSDGNGTMATTTVVTAVSVLTNAAVTATTPATSTIYGSTSAPVGYAEGKLYTEADTIDVLLNNAADQLKITIRAFFIPVNGL